MWLENLENLAIKIIKFQWKVCWGWFQRFGVELTKMKRINSFLNANVWVYLKSQKFSDLNQCQYICNISHMSGKFYFVQVAFKPSLQVPLQGIYLLENISGQVGSPSSCLIIFECVLCQIFSRIIFLKTV